MNIEVYRKWGNLYHLLIDLLIDFKVNGTDYFGGKKKSGKKGGREAKEKE